MASKNSIRPTPEQLAYNLGQAARILGVSKPTMSRLLSEIQHRRVGRRVLIPKSSLEDWLAEEK